MPRILWLFLGAELRASAEAAVSFVERVASQRAGLPARARTVAFCGYDGTVAYSMIGEMHDLLRERRYLWRLYRVSYQ